MFSFLKNKIKDAFSKIKKEEVEIEQESQDNSKEEIQKEELEKTIKEEKRETKKEKKKEESKGEQKEKIDLIEEKIETLEKEVDQEIKEEKKGFFNKIKETISTTKISESKFEELFSIIEIALLENNVAYEVVEKVREDLKSELAEKAFKRGDLANKFKDYFKESLSSIFVEPFDLIEKINSSTSKPFVINFIGINGTGKTTTTAKIVHLLKKYKISCIVSASDTFRAASIEQLQHHADKLGVKIIKHDYGSDPAAVAYDAIQHAKSKNIQVVLIDTAGRMHSNTNLIDELKKIKRVAKPDLNIFIGESITGNDCIEQAKVFDKAIEIDAIILSKADIDEKGGTALSISYILKKPIIYLGMGQDYENLKKFDSSEIIKNLGL